MCFCLGGDPECSSTPALVQPAHDARQQSLLLDDAHRTILMWQLQLSQLGSCLQNERDPHCRLAASYVAAGLRLSCGPGGPSSIENST